MGHKKRVANCIQLATLYNPPPVFFGHYWMEDAWPVIQSHNVICLDYSVAKGGCLVAYRFEGEGEVRNEGFVWEGAEE